MYEYHDDDDDDDGYDEQGVDGPQDVEDNEEEEEEGSSGRLEAAKEAAKEAGKEVAEEAAKKAVKKAVGAFLKKAAALLLSKPVLIALVVVVVIAAVILVGIIAVKGEKSAQAQGRHNAINVSDEAKDLYRELEGQLYPEEDSETNDTNKDYAGLYPTWNVMVQIDSVFFNGKGTTPEFKPTMMEIIEKLKPNIITSRTDYDTVHMYKWTEVKPAVVDKYGKEVSPAQYDWVPAGTKQIERLIVEKAETWEGTVTRQYSKILTQDDRETLQNPAVGTIAEVKEEWMFETDIIYTHAKYKAAYKEFRPAAWDSDIEDDIIAIYTMGEYGSLDDDVESSGLGQFDNGLVYGAGEYAWPMPLSYKVITNSFGYRRIFIDNHWRERMHNGIDIPAPTGTPVYPTKPGKVAFAAPKGEAGNMIIIDHGKDSNGQRIASVYMHLNRFLVKAGDTVDLGKPIGQVGNTGGSKGAHLHFEIHVNDVKVDPLKQAQFRVKYTGNTRNDPVKYPGNNSYLFLGVPAGGSQFSPGAAIGSDAEVELVARVAWAEASISGDQGIRGVVETVRNRMNSPLWRQPKSPSSLVKSPEQYDGIKYIMTNRPPDSKLPQLMQMVRDVFAGKSNVILNSVYFAGNEAYPRGSAYEYANFMAPGKASAKGLEFAVQFGIGKNATNFYRVKGTANASYALPIALSDSGTTLGSGPTAQIVNYSKTLLGIPYKWGGSTPKTGLDCSGFVKYVYAHFGIALNRVSRDQAKQGIRVDKRELLPGDLVFFDTKGAGYITHVGMYIGNDQMIHAPRTGDVIKIVPFSGKKGFVTARRIIKS